MSQGLDAQMLSWLLVSYPLLSNTQPEVGTENQ